MKKQLLIIGITLLLLVVGLSGCNTPNENNINDFKVTLHDVNVFLSNRNYVELWLYLNINNYNGERLTLGSLTYILRGNSLYFSGGELKSFSDNSRTLQSAFAQFTDTISLYGINPTLNSTLLNRQPVTWTVSGELTLYRADNISIMVPFNNLTYYMTEYD